MQIANNSQLVITKSHNPPMQIASLTGALKLDEVANQYIQENRRREGNLHTESEAIFIVIHKREEQNSEPMQ